MATQLELTIQSNATIASNVQEVSAHCMEQLEKYRGCIATPETIKADKDACAKINKLKEFIKEQRIEFDRAVNNQPDVKAIHDALKAVEVACDEIRKPYWESVKAITVKEESPEEYYNVSISMKHISNAQKNKVFASLTKMGIAFSIRQKKG